MTDKTTTHYSELKNRNYTRKVYEMNNSEYYYRPTIHNNHFAMQKTKQVKKIKEDAFYNSDSIENIELVAADEPKSLFELTEEKNTVTQALLKLTPREERVIRMRFGIGTNIDHTAEEVGQVFSVTRDRIFQIESKALLKLKKYSNILKKAA